MTRNLWLERTVIFVSMLVAPPCWPLDLGGLFGSGDDSGSGKVAKFEFRVKDGFAATSIAWSPDGKYIATSGTQTRLVHIWDVEQRKLVKEIELPHPPGSLFHNMSWSSDGRYLATCNSFQSSLRIYDAKDWTVAKDFGRNEALACQKPIFSDDGQELTVWAGDLVTWDVNGWKEKRRLKGVIDDGQYARQMENAWNSSISVRDVSYIPGTHVLALGGGRYEHGAVDACGAIPPVYTNRVWFVAPGDSELARSLIIYCSSGAGGDVTHLVGNPDGTQLAVVAFEHGSRNVHVIDLSTGKVSATPLGQRQTGIPQSIAYTPDRRFLLIGEDRGSKETSTVYVVDARTSHVLDVFHAIPEMHDLAVNPRGSSFAVSSFDGFSVWKFTSQ